MCLRETDTVLNDMDPLTIATIIIGGVGALVSGGAGIFSAIKSSKTQQSINSQNVKATEDVNQQNIDFQMQENQIMRDREDTAHQREVDDLKKAGLSPLASLSGANAAAGSVPVLSAPQQDASGFIDAQNFIAQAGLNVGNGLMDISNTIFKEHSTDERQRKQIDFDGQQNDLNRQNAVDMLQSEIDAANERQDKELAQDLTKFQQNLENLKYQSDMERAVRDKHKAFDLIEQRKDMYRETFGDQIRFSNPISDPEEYLRSCNAFDQYTWSWLLKHPRSNYVGTQEKTLDTSLDSTLGTGEKSGSRVPKAYDLLNMKAQVDASVATGDKTYAQGIEKWLSEFIDDLNASGITVPIPTAKCLMSVW